MAPAFVQSNGSASNLGGAATVALGFTTQNTAPGNLLVAVFQNSANTVTLSSVTDNQGVGNNWVVGPKVQLGAGGYNVYFAYALNTIGGSKPTVTAHYSASTTLGYAAIGEFSGVNAFRAMDTGNTGASASPVSNPITTVAGDLSIGYLGTSGGNPAIAAGSGYQLGQIGSQSAGPTNSILAFEYKLNSTAGSNTAGWTITSVNWGAGIAAFFQQSSSGGQGNSPLGSVIVDLDSDGFPIAELQTGTLA